MEAFLLIAMFLVPFFFICVLVLAFMYAGVKEAHLFK
jgi:hypothetical protein